MRVIVADDDEVFRVLVDTVLRELGHAVVLTANGAAAWDAYLEGPASLVVLDWQMPILDGLDVVRRIRQHEQGDATHVLMVTARDREEDLESVLNAGADDYIAKPLSRGALRARVLIAEQRIKLDELRRETEAALRRARYLAGIGETAIALQHEINNPLAALLGHVQLVRQGYVPPEELPAVLEQVSAQAQRIADVVARLSQIGEPRTVPYALGAKMLDLGEDPGAPRTP
jgi:DNA-binding response OmpR family regulator